MLGCHWLSRIATYNKWNTSISEAQKAKRFRGMELFRTLPVLEATKDSSSQILVSLKYYIRVACYSAPQCATGRLPNTSTPRQLTSNSFPTMLGNIYFQRFLVRLFPAFFCALLEQGLEAPHMSGWPCGLSKNLRPANK